MRGVSGVDLSVKDSGLFLQGERLDPNVGWKIHMASSTKLLLSCPSKVPVYHGDQSGLGWAGGTLIGAIVKGLVEQEFSGVLTLETAGAVKRLYFSGGDLVFAGSSLMDDRLGEVIYRAGLISLDQLAEAAVQVTRSRKFGQVLLDSGVFSPAQLWDSLRLQVINIFESVFLADIVYFQVEEGEHLAPSALSLDDGALELLDDAQGYSAMLKGFLRRLNHDSALSLNEAVLERMNPSPGTFLWDLVELVRHHNTVAEFLASSKLSELYSQSCLFDLVHRNLVRLHSDAATNRSGERMSIPKELKSLIDAYHLILDAVKKAFSAESAEFPIDDMEEFLDREYSFRGSALFLESDGTLAGEAVAGIAAKAATSRRQAHIVVVHLRGLILFLLQLAGDLLPGTKGWELKRSLQHLVT